MTFIAILVFSNQFSLASVRIPIDTLRSQSGTMHCWAYAMSHLLEARGLGRDSFSVMFDVERDTKYWVDYERLWSVYRSESDVYMGNVELGWQMEFWESLLKHGRPLYRTALGSTVPNYPILKPFTSPWGFIAATENHTPGSSALSPAEMKQKIQSGGFATETDIESFIIDSLDKWYGRPADTTRWFHEAVPLQKVVSHVLGSDFPNASLESFVLVKPVSDGNHQWVKYLDGRYWGYRYDKRLILGLINQSLDANWPVSFDNGRHAMTIVGYETTSGGTYYAIADSIGRKITWVLGANLLPSLNLLTVFHRAIDDLVPTIPAEPCRTGIDYDRLDHTDRPLCW